MDQALGRRGRDFGPICARHHIWTMSDYLFIHTPFSYLNIPERVPQLDFSSHSLRIDDVDRSVGFLGLPPSHSRKFT